MTKILIHRQKNGFTTALTQNGKLIELIADPAQNGSITGNIYAGIVKKISLGFLFIDIGEARPAFLDTSDSREKGLYHDGKLQVKQGDTLVVQIIKDASDHKGATATSNISFNEELVVLSKSHSPKSVYVSKKIDSEAERTRLENIAKKHLPSGFSAIIRTAAAHAGEENISREIKRLTQKFHDLQKWQHVKAPAALLAQPPILKTFHEIFTKEVNQIATDCFETFELIKETTDKIILYEGHEPIFEHFFIKTQIDKLQCNRVWLKSGGFIVIEPTQAAVMIDVNTGKCESARSKDARLKVNMEAAAEVARQLRLRNLSGLILIDFVRMSGDEDKLTAFLRTELAKDRIPCVVVGFTKLGLMEMTRKRVRPSSFSTSAGP